MSIKPPADPGAPPADSHVPAPGPSGSTGATPGQQSRRTVIVLLVVIAILLAVIAGLLLTRTPMTTFTGAPEPTPTSTVQEASAPTLTAPKALEIVHGEVTRDPDDPRAKGKADAPVVMVIYSDFGCPYCTLFAQEVEPTLSDLIEDGTLRIEWRDLAQITPTSPLAAQAGIAAGNQGKFWEFHDAVYAAADPKGHPAYTEDSLVDFAKKAGVADLSKFRTDMTAAETVKAVSESTQHVHSIGIQGTPFMIVGETYINGYKDADYMTAVVKSQAAKAKEAQGAQGATGTASPTSPAAPASAH